jgi:hypothetical protein
MKVYSYREIVASIIFTRGEKNIEVREPIPGLRHNQQTVYVRHRFPVKGGIDSAEHIARIIESSNPLFNKFKGESFS